MHLHTARFSTYEQPDISNEAGSSGYRDNISRLRTPSFHHIIITSFQLSFLHIHIPTSYSSHTYVSPYTGVGSMYTQDRSVGVPCEKKVTCLDSFETRDGQAVYFIYKTLVRDPSFLPSLNFSSYALSS